MIRLGLRFIAAYGLMVALWFVVRPAADATLVWLARTVGHGLCGTALVSVELGEPETSLGLGSSCVMTLQARHPRVTPVCRWNTHSVAYLPIAFFAAMVLAIPGGLRRWRRTLLGLVLLHVLVVVRLAVTILHIGSNELVGLFREPPPIPITLARIDAVLASQESGLILSLFLGVALFWKDLRQVFLDGADPATGP